MEDFLDKQPLLSSNTSQIPQTFTPVPDTSSESNIPPYYPPKGLKEDSQVWQNAIHKYYDELGKGGIKGPAIDKDLWNIKSPLDLLNQIRALEPADARASRVWLGGLRRLETILLGLNDFAVVTAWALGMNGRVAAVVWGSIRLILSVCYDCQR